MELTGVLPSSRASISAEMRIRTHAPYWLTILIAFGGWLNAHLEINGHVKIEDGMLKVIEFQVGGK